MASRAGDQQLDAAAGDGLTAQSRLGTRPAVRCVLCEGPRPLGPLTLAPQSRDADGRSMSTRFRPNRVALAAYAGFIALSAYCGSIGLISGLLPVNASLAERLPFHSPVFGGIALALVVGLPASFVAALSWRGHARTPDAGALAGLLLVGWIAVELAIAREFSALQVVYAAAGAGLIAAGNVAVLRQVAEVAAALPLFVTAPLWRHWHLRWGAPPGPPCLLSASRPQEGDDASTGRARGAAAGPEGIDLYWLPLGAGGHSVRWNGKVYEALAAWHERRRSQDLYHSALEVRHGGRRYVIEMAPVWSEASPDRGVGCEGPVGARWLGRFRAFRYEVRCWPEGRIPDVLEAVDSPRRLSDDPAAVVELLQRTRDVPA